MLLFVIYVIIGLLVIVEPWLSGKEDPLPESLIRLGFTISISITIFIIVYLSSSPESPTSHIEPYNDLRCSLFDEFILCSNGIVYRSIDNKSTINNKLYLNTMPLQGNSGDDGFFPLYLETIP